MLILLHNLEWAQNDKNYTSGKLFKSHPAPPLHIPSDRIEKWLFDKDNHLEHHPGLWLRFYHAYSFYLQPHGMVIADSENIIPTKYQKVYKKLHLTKKIDIRHESKSVYRDTFKPQLLANPEFQYLQKRLEEPHIIDFFKAKKIEHIPNRSKLKILFLESFT